MSLFFSGTGGINLGPDFGTGNINLVVSYPFTISCWFYTTSVAPAGIKDLVNLSVSTTNETYWIDHSAALLRAETWNGTSGQLASTGTIVANQWQHAVGRFVSNTSRIINLNGAAGVQNTTNSAQISQVIDTLSIGASEANTRFFIGYIAHVAIYNGALQNSDAVSLARGMSPLAVRSANLIAYYPLCNPGVQRNIASPRSIVDNPLPILRTGTRYSNWNPPVKTVLPKSQILRLPVEIVSAGNTPVLYHQRQQQGMAS